MAVKLTRLTHKTAIQQHLVAESCTICSSRSRRLVRKLLDTPSYIPLLYLNSAASNHHAPSCVTSCVEIRLGHTMQWPFTAPTCQVSERRQGKQEEPCLNFRMIYFHTIQWYQGLLPWGWSSQVVKLTTHLHLVPRSSIHGTTPPLPQYVFMAWRLVKHRDNFTFTFTFTFFTVFSNNMIIRRKFWGNFRSLPDFGKVVTFVPFQGDGESDNRKQWLNKWVIWN
jgi:hypothetical protein